MVVPKKVAIIGAGNWGSTCSLLVGRNVLRYPEFDDQVRMWVYEEVVNGEPLTKIINSTHENVKYLPGIKLPDNVVALPDLVDVVRDASVLIFVLPHQFLAKACATIKPHITDSTIAISLIKGIEFDENGAVLLTNVIESYLGIDCSVLSGANIASEIARGKFCESTVGYNVPDNGKSFYKLFNNTTFRISLIPDVIGPQVYGGLKNVIALGAGFCDALDMGFNTKSALMRIGLVEMQHFADVYFKSVDARTIIESCGVADLITTCMGGRNRRVAEAFGRARGASSWEDLENKLLNGQKLQGTSTCREVWRLIERDSKAHEFPFIHLIKNVAFDNAKLETILNLPLPKMQQVFAQL